MGTSVKTVPVGGGGTWSNPNFAFSRKTDISARVLGSSGQKTVPSWQPTVMRLRAIVSIWSWNSCDGGTSLKSTCTLAVPGRELQVWPDSTTERLIVVPGPPALK